MTKRLLLAAVVCAAAFGTAVLAASTHPDGALIVPGRRVGQVRLGENAKILAPTLGNSNFADSAMGRDWSTWYTHSHAIHKKDAFELDILTERDESGLHSHVQQVWLTSPWFHTRDGIAVGTRWARIRSAFPAIRLLLRNSVQQPPKELYDDVRQGVGFEEQGGRCIAIIVHAPDTAAPDHYYSHYGNGHWLPVKQ